MEVSSVERILSNELGLISIAAKIVPRTCDVDGRVPVYTELQLRIIWNLNFFSEATQGDGSWRTI